MSRWSKLHRAVNWLAARFCRHEAGVVCDHRAWDHDQRLRGYFDGFAAATAHAEAKRDPFYPWPRLEESDRA